jgi:hypothetical protein
MAPMQQRHVDEMTLTTTPKIEPENDKVMDTTKAAKQLICMTMRAGCSFESH